MPFKMMLKSLKPWTHHLPARSFAEKRVINWQLRPELISGLDKTFFGSNSLHSMTDTNRLSSESVFDVYRAATLGNPILPYSNGLVT